ncbi:hypothetical protein BDZ89DRAFT_1072829 [Hymenopellis radicata]|nr:hypothetical protein BDZ89DRAFT_1072829 [Hymenopellis radicata]
MPLNKEAPIDKEPVLTQEEEKKEESAVPTAKPTEEAVKEPVPDDQGAQDAPGEEDPDGLFPPAPPGQLPRGRVNTPTSGGSGGHGKPKPK